MLKGLPKLPKFRGGGRKITIGRPVGDVVSYGPTRSATLYIGLKKGVQPENNAGACERKPQKFQLRSLDSTFTKGRAAQVGTDNVNATRRKGRGWFEGSPEESASYEVIYIPSDSEGSYEAFRSNMNRLAESIGKKLCQDSVIIVHSDGGKRQSCDARWFKDGGDECK